MHLLHPTDQHAEYQLLIRNMHVFIRKGTRGIVSTKMGMDDLDLFKSRRRDG